MALVKGAHGWIMAFMYSAKISLSLEGLENESSAVTLTNNYQR